MIHKAHIALPVCYWQAALPIHLRGVGVQYRQFPNIRMTPGKLTTTSGFDMAEAPAQLKEWLGKNFTPDELANGADKILADIDGDGYSSLVEFACGLAPKSFEMGAFMGGIPNGGNQIAVGQSMNADEGTGIVHGIEVGNGNDVWRDASKGEWTLEDLGGGVFEWKNLIPGVPYQAYKISRNVKNTHTTDEIELAFIRPTIEIEFES